MTFTFRRVRALQLAVVVLIVVVVAGLMMNNALKTRESARTASAQALARSALMIQRAHFYGTGVYADAEALRDGEPKVDATEEVAVQGKVYVRTEGQTTILASSSKDGTCYWIRDANGVASYATTPCTEEPNDDDFGPNW